MEKIKIIMDVDTGIDDAIAMCLALGNEKIEVLGFTTTYGNRGVDRTTENTLKILELTGKTDIPVAKGATRPIVTPFEEGIKSFIHGVDGIGDIQPPLPAPSIKPLEITAVEFMAQTLRNADQPITLVPVGPLTNVATLVMAHPELMPKIKEVVIMGGSTMQGNRTAVAEANIADDPEAAHIVFKSGLKIKMAGLDATHKGYFTFDEIKELADRNRIAGTIYKMCDVYIAHCRDRMKLPGIAMHDSLPVAWLISPEIVTSEDYYVTVDINGRHTYGMTVTDVHRTLNEKPNATVALDVDRLKFTQLIEDAFNALS